MRTRYSQSNILTLFACIFILEIVCFINSFITNLKGGTVDAERFHANGVEWMKSGSLAFEVDAAFYDQFLGIIYTLIYPSQFIGAQFGIIALTVGAFYLLRIAFILGEKMPSWAIVAFLLWPSVVLRVTTTLREPYLVACLIILCYYLISFKITNSKSDLIKCLLACVIGFFFHKAYALFLMVVIAYVAFFAVKPKTASARAKLFYLRIAIVGGGVAGITYVATNFGNVRGLAPLIAAVNGDVEYISKVLASKAGRDFRATYGVTLDFTSPGALITSIPPVIVYYMFAPFPWQIRSIWDPVASFEGIFRGIAIFMLIKYHFVRNVFPPALRPATVVVVLLCLIWAAGTTNYGTASRHHVTTNWFFIFIFVMYFNHMKDIRKKRNAVHGARVYQGTIPSGARV